MRRTRRLLDQRIIREITPIFDTRALGYASMLVAAKVDADHPQRAARIVNSHPGVSHNYLRTHEFNLWFTIATPPDSETRASTATLEVLQEQTGAESIRQLPTLTLFKINMNLEMEQGTDALAAAVDATPPRELERQPYDDLDIAVDPGPPGPDGGHRAPLRRRRRAGRDGDGRLPRPPRGDGRAPPAEAGRGDPPSPPRRVLRERDGGVAGARGPGARDRSADGRRSRDLALLPAPDLPDWPYSVFTMAHGRSKEECDAILDGIADEHQLHGDDRAVLYSSTEFKKVRLLYFTDDYARWEGEHAGA